MKYGLGMRLAHWIMALIILTLLASGLYMADLANSDFKWMLYRNHKALGMLALAAIIIRIIIRSQSIIPQPASQLKKWELMLSKVVHILLYAMMLIMPISGFLMADMFAEEKGVSFFGLFSLNILDTKIEWLMEVTEFLHHEGSEFLLVLIGLHFAGVIKHQLIDKPKIPLLKRMM